MNETRENNGSLLDSAAFTVREDEGCFRVFKPSALFSKKYYTHSFESSKGYGVGVGNLKDSNDNEELLYFVKHRSKISELNGYKPSLYGTKMEYQGMHSEGNEILDKEGIWKKEDKHHGNKDDAFTSKESKGFELTSKCENVLIQNDLHAQDGDLKNCHKEIENKLETSVGSNTQNNLLVLKEEKKEIHQSDSKEVTKATKNYTSIVISETVHDAQLQANGQQTKIYKRKEKISNKHYSVRTKTYNENLNSSSVSSNKGYDIQNGYANYTNRSDIYWGNLNNNCFNMCYPLFYPQYEPLQMYQYWPYLGYFSPDQFDWCSSLQAQYQKPEETSAETSLSYTPQPQGVPYTGVAGYNWPTVRKPLKIEIPEEKTHLPVYVKPPVVGNEETEQIRTAYIKYVKHLKQTIFRRYVRKRKQLERRERNYKIRMSYKLTRPGNKGSESGDQEKYVDSGDSPENPQDIRHPPIKIRQTTLPFLSASLSYGTLQSCSSGKNNNSSEEGNAILEHSFGSDVNPTMDSVVISEQDFSQAKNSNVSNNPEDIFSVKAKSIHPIFGPVCYRKEALLDAYLSSKIPPEFRS